MGRSGQTAWAWRAAELAEKISAVTENSVRLRAPFLCAMLAGIAAFERPSTGRQLLAIATICLATLSRFQMVVLMPALLCSIVVVAWAEARERPEMSMASLFGGVLPQQWLKEHLYDPQTVSALDVLTLVRFWPCGNCRECNFHTEARSLRGPSPQREYVKNPYGRCGGARTRLRRGGPIVGART
jgi:hypothetical protein